MTITRYIGNPGNFAGNGPVTLLGRLLDTFLSILEILIFAVPAGLVANGFSQAIEEEKKKEYLDNVRNKIYKGFRHVHSASFQDYVKEHPEMPQHTYFWAPQNVSMAQLETSGINLSDILNVVNEYPEFRLKNMAKAISVEQHPEDRLVLEHFPLNTPYGCCINRKSNVTIVAAGSVAEIGTGWFAYYLAKFGGFNFISKEIEVDPLEPDSYNAMSTQIQVNGMTQKELEVDPKLNKKELALLEKKRAQRELFLNDLKSLYSGDNAWCITLLSHIKNKTNTTDIHLSYSKSEQQDPTVNCMDSYLGMLDDMTKSMQKEFGLTVENSTRYPHKTSNLAYKVRKEDSKVNGFSVRVSTDIVCYDARVSAIMHQMASVLNKNFKGKGMLSEEAAAFKKRLFGYAETNVNE